MARILIIDDDQGLRAAIAKALRQVGHDPVEAGDGREGLNAARSGAFDLVIADIVMPDQDGIEAIVQLRSLEPSPAIIAISGASGPGGFTPLVDAGLLGADRMLKKPFTFVELLAAVGELVGREGRGAV